MSAHASANVVIVGADANARLPVDVEGCTGGLQFGQPDELGEEVVQVLARHGLYVPSTYEGLHKAPSHTWRHAKGTLARIDYVCVRADVPVILVPHEDHHAVVWQATVCPGADVNPQSPEGRETLRRRMYCPPARHVHPDEHGSHLQSFLQEVLVADFLKPPKGPRSVYQPSCVGIQREMSSSQTSDEKAAFGSSACFKPFSAGRTVRMPFLRQSRKVCCCVNSLPLPSVLLRHGQRSRL